MGLPQGFVVESVEVHAAGEAGRVITNMGHLIEGATMAERFEFVKKNFDGFRKLIIREPRGYPAVCGVFITSSFSNKDSSLRCLAVTQFAQSPQCSKLDAFQCRSRQLSSRLTPQSARFQ
jgi:proline racemase